MKTSDHGQVKTSIPWYRRLGFRMGVVLFVGLFVVDTALMPVWNWVFGALTPEWLDPDYVRGYAEELELMTESERAELLWSTALTESDLLFAILATAIYAAIFASILGGFVSIMATRRVRQLTQQANQRSGEDERVPGPFSAEGRDEITLLAQTMNRMRSQSIELLDAEETRATEHRAWVAEVAHDLRTPLTALAMSLDQASPHLEAMAPSPHRHAIADLISSARFDVARVQDLAEDLLEVARLDAGDALILEPIPVVELIRETLGGLRPTAKDRGIEFELKRDDILPELVGDGRRLMRAVENLLMNSLQFAQTRVEVSVRKLEGSVCIRIEDDGPGLPEVDGKVVVSELRGRLSRKDSSGIGLEVAEKVVRAHGGELVAANSQRGGARVEMRLPLEINLTDLSSRSI